MFYVKLSIYYNDNPDNIWHSTLDYHPCKSIKEANEFIKNRILLDNNYIDVYKSGNGIVSKTFNLYKGFDGNDITSDNVYSFYEHNTEKLVTMKITILEDASTDLYNNNELSDDDYYELDKKFLVKVNCLINDLERARDLINDYNEIIDRMMADLMLDKESLNNNSRPINLLGTDLENNINQLLDALGIF